MARSLLCYLALIQHAALILAQNDCVLTVPPNPLTAQGLATPYTQTGCDQRMFADQGSYVEAAIWDPATNSFTMYHPLVVNKGDVAGKNFIAPLVPTVPAGAIVSLSFGTNGGTLTLAGNGAQQANCVNGINQNGALSIFGQFAYCNSVAFFAAAQAAIANGNLVIPAPGTANDGTPCPTSRDFRIVDMDPNDNVLTTYLLLKNGMLAQNTPANAGNNTGAQVLANGSDEGLVASILDPLVGCTPFKVPSITAPTGMSASLTANELQAGKFPANPVSLVPMNDPMVVLTDANGAITQSTAKTNLYRAGVGQPPVSNAATGDGATFCKNFAASCIYINNNKGLFSGAASPMPAVANNLFTFMGQRFANSFAAAPALDCVNLLGNGNPIPNPIQLTTDANGVVTAVTINTQECQQILNGQMVTGGGTATSSAAASASATTSSATATATKKHRGFSRRRGGRARVVRKSI